MVGLKWFQFRDGDLFPPPIELDPATKQLAMLGQRTWAVHAAHVCEDLGLTPEDLMRFCAEALQARVDLAFMAKRPGREGEFASYCGTREAFDRATADLGEGNWRRVEFEDTDFPELLMLAAVSAPALAEIPNLADEAKLDLAIAMMVAMGILSLDSACAEPDGASRAIDIADFSIAAIQAAYLAGRNDQIQAREPGDESAPAKLLGSMGGRGRAATDPRSTELKEQAKDMYFKWKRRQLTFANQSAFINAVMTATGLKSFNNIAEWIRKEWREEELATRPNAFQPYP